MLLAFACFIVAGFCVGGSYSLYKQGKPKPGLVLGLFALLAGVAGGLWYVGSA